jgi:hypothetical protein
MKCSEECPVDGHRVLIEGIREAHRAICEGRKKVQEGEREVFEGLGRLTMLAGRLCVESESEEELAEWLKEIGESSAKNDDS